MKNVSFFGCMGSAHEFTIAYVVRETRETRETRESRGSLCVKRSSNG